ncbi:extracellular solute-binding protein [Paenibacillus sp. CC-CFT747]|nr:extracellular solute-binding protein [Paenibacillus sp. CC-CFT747]
MRAGAALGAAGKVAIGLLALALSGCTGEERTHPERTDALPVSLMVTLHQPSEPSREMLDIFNRMIGAELQIDWVPSDIYREKLLNAVETNTLKKVTGVNESDYYLLKNAIRSEMFWEIGPFLDAYPNLSKLDPKVLRQTAVDGKLYGLYSERWPSRQGLIIRKDWMDKLGLRPPETTDELYTLLSRFTKDDPDGNGKADTYGLTDRNDLIYGAFKTFSSYFGTPNNWTLSNGRPQPDFMTGAYLDTMDYMKKLYDEGLINRDFAVTSKQIQRYRFLTGQAGVMVGAMDDAPRLQDELKRIQPNAELALVNRIEGPQGFGIWSIPDYSGIFLFSKRAIPTESELKRILAVYDRMLEPGPTNFLRYGIQDKHYKVIEGKVAPEPGMNEDRNANVLPFYSLMIQNISNPGLLRLSDKGQQPLVVLAQRLTDDNGKHLIRDPMLGLSSPTYDAKGTELSDIITNATYHYILGQLDRKGFEEQVKLWRQAGGDKVMEELAQAHAAKPGEATK